MGMFISLYVNYSSGSEAFVIGGLTSLVLWGILILLNKKKNVTSENTIEQSSSDKTSDINKTVTNSSNTIVDDINKTSTISSPIETENKDMSNEKNENVHKSDIKAYNRMSAVSLMMSQKSNLQFIKNPDSGKMFFKCGEIKGYVTPAVQDCLDEVTVEQLQFAEVSIDGKPAVPCLMMLDNKYRKVERTITLASQIDAAKRAMKRKLVNAFEVNIEEVKDKIDDTIFGNLILTTTIASTYQALKEQETLKLICETQNINFIELLDEVYEEIKIRFNNDLP